MREILFRGKRIDNSEWVEGCLEITHVQPLQKRSYDLYEIRNITVENNHSTCMKGFCVEVDPSTVGQFTGLTDKNGKKIFEGDILRFENDDEEFSLYSCEWDGKLCGWIIRFLEYDTPCDAFDALFCMDAEVIGTIHDNPELLEVSGDD